MDNKIGADDAARALTEIGHRQEQLIRRVAIPDWYWWVLGVLTVALEAVSESGHGLVFGIAVTAYVAGQIAVAWRRVLRARVAAPRKGLAEPVTAGKMLVGITIYATVVVTVTIAVGLSLKAAKVPHPGTLASLAGVVPLVLGGPILTRRLGGFTRGWRSGSRG